MATATAAKKTTGRTAAVAKAPGPANAAAIGKPARRVAGNVIKLMSEPGLGMLPAWEKMGEENREVFTGKLEKMLHREIGKLTPS